MASTMSSFSIVVSGLHAAQTGLSVVGHNMSNAETTGYTRQQSIQQDYAYTSKGSCDSGSGLLQVGLGTDVGVIRQIRNKFYDVTFREQNSSGNYYAVKYNTGLEVQTILGELESDYKAQDIINDVWDAINELTIYPEGIESRDTFIETCVTFLNKMQNVSSNMVNYQMNLNGQVKNTVSDINEILDQINEINFKIVSAEYSGQRANDYRDTRNNLLDELSSYLDITVKENENNTVSVLYDGNELVVNGAVNKLGLRYSSGVYPFVEPVFSSEEGILPYGSEAKALFGDLSTANLSAESGNATGGLKGMLISRGNCVANYTTSDTEVNNYMIPKMQKDLDTLCHAIVTLLNDSVAPYEGDKPYDLNGNQSGIEIFVRQSGYDRYTQLESTDDYNSLYTINNLEINPLLLESDGYNYLAFSKTGDLGDQTLLNEISQLWKTGLDALGGDSIDNYYKNTVADFAIEVEEAYTFQESQLGMVDNVENKRMSLSGVSLDEELTSMLKYQHAYNAAAKMLNILDSMVSKVVNETGRVGR